MFEMNELRQSRKFNMNAVQHVWNQQVVDSTYALNAWNSLKAGFCHNCDKPVLAGVGR